MSKNPKVARIAYSVKEGVWASYYIYQYYEYSNQGDGAEARDARDMAAAHGINGAIGWHPVGFAIVQGTEIVSQVLVEVGILPRPVSFGEFVVADCYLIANLVGISDNTPSIIGEQIDEYKYECDALAMEVLLNNYLNAPGEVYVGDLP